MEYIKNWNKWKLLINENKIYSDNMVRYTNTLKNVLIGKGYYRDKNDQSLINDFNGVKKILERDCSPFLKELKMAKQLVFRGIKKMSLSDNYKVNNINDFYIKNRRRDRRPVDIDYYISEKIDDIFYDKFGFKIRSEGVYTSKSPYISRQYSDIFVTDYYSYDTIKNYIFFPIGEYDHYWSPKIDDLFPVLEGEDWYDIYIGSGGYIDEYIENLYKHRFDNPIHRNESYFTPEGNFFFFEEKLENKNKNSLIDEIIHRSDEFGLIKNDKGCYFKNNKLVFCNDSKVEEITGLKWVPDVTEREFFKENYFILDEKLEELVDTYIKNHYLYDIYFNNEITFDCDKYYILSDEYYLLLIDWLFNE